MAGEVEIDWSDCDEVEQIPGKVSGVPILKRTRVQPEAITGNHADGFTAVEIAEMFRLDLDQVKAVLDYAARESTEERPKARQQSSRTKAAAPAEMEIDWSGCVEVEQVPGKVSGVPILRGTRVQAEAIVGNHADGYSAVEVAAMFELDLDQVKTVLDYAARKAAEVQTLPTKADVPAETAPLEVQTDWSGCDEVEQMPGKVSGRPILKGSRVIADSILPNFEGGYSAEEIANDIYGGITVEQVQKVLDYVLDKVAKGEPVSRA